jgi:hypothetical protein
MYRPNRKRVLSSAFGRPGHPRASITVNYYNRYVADVIIRLLVRLRARRFLSRMWLFIHGNQLLGSHVCIYAYKCECILIFLFNFLF